MYFLMNIIDSSFLILCPEEVSFYLYLSIVCHFLCYLYYLE